MTIKTKLLALFGGVFIFIISMNIYITDAQKQAMFESEQVHDYAEHRIVMGLTIEVNFKKQVQEWKNILLRGYDPELYTKYLNKFITEEANTRRAAEELRKDLSKNNEAFKLIEQFIKSHTYMGARYREALTAFKVAEHDPHITVDKYVRGIDREPTELLNSLIDLVKNQREVLLKNITQEMLQTDRILLLATWIGFFVVGLFLYFAIKYTLLIPINKLSVATVQLTKGDLQYRTYINGNDEFSHLGTQFNKMAGELDAAQQGIRRRNAHIRGIFNTVNEGIITMHDWGHMINVNPAAEKMFGYTNKQIIALSFTDLLSENDKIKYENYIKMYNKNNSVEILGSGPHELTGLHKDGREFPIEVSINEMDTTDEKLFVGVIRDISQRKEQEQRLRHMANFDMLTGLPNRNLFKDRLHQAMQLALRKEWLIAVMYIDLDIFKRINDTLGHAAGDELLKEVSKRLQANLRASDTVARLGGDEFSILIEDVRHIEQIITVAEQIIEAMNKPFNINKLEVLVTASIGITVYPFENNDVDNLLQMANIAMHKVKEHGRNGYRFYSVDMDKFALERLNMESRLRQALKNEEFILHYQPQVDLKTGKIIGVEALLRWEQPGKGLIPPLQFLPLLEETGLIIPVGEQILIMACEQTRLWQQQGFENIKMSVNLSARQFDDDQLVDKIIDILTKANIDSRLLELEVTESAIMQDAAISQEKLQTLAYHGFSIAIDDFGTGYSSLAYLKEFPVDTLKIDRSFVKDLEHQNNDRAIAHAIVNLAQALNLSVVAEGVENDLQLKILAELNCDIIQGYYFSKPLNAEDMTRMLKADHTLDVSSLITAKTEKARTHSN